MKKVLYLNYGRPFPTAEPDGESVKFLDIKSFRIVWGNIEVTDLKGEIHYLPMVCNLFYYNGVYYSDIWVEMIHDNVASEQFDINKTKLTNPLPIQHPSLGEVLQILTDEIEVDGETMQYILEECNMDEQMFKQLLNTKDYVSNYLAEYLAERKEGKGKNKELKHRLKMIEEDMAAIVSFIKEGGLSETFKNPTPFTDEAWTHISNIEIACNLQADESLNWKPFRKN
jgi:hypothetical protein